ncbi:MAG TPA: DUF971 domain-containing protein [Gammaproteobacteria bacterium]|nr:DUF971 domain-containing protein [Gammaproteobacteria bacterium]
MTRKPQPTALNLHTKSRLLGVSFDDGSDFELSCEFLRIHSPSAEVRGHGAGQETLQLHKENVAITDVEPVGNYGVKLVFDDGHSTGIYSWDYLYDLGSHQQEYWQTYLESLKRAGVDRKTDG